MKYRQIVARWVGWLLLGLVALCARVQAAETRLRVELVWGTNDAKPAEKDFKELDKDSRERLGRTLRWKNYFVVNRQESVLPAKDPKRLQLSSQCAIDVRQVGNQVEVRIHHLKAGAEPKLVDTKRYDLEKLKAGELFTFAGSSKDNWDDAWLVIVRMPPAAP